MRSLRRLAVILIPALLAGERAGAEEARIRLPDEIGTVESRKNFRLCRIATLFELEAETRTDLPPALVEAMREQIEFIMADTLFNLPALSIEDGGRRVAFFEDWTLSFSRDIVDVREGLEDLARRRTILLNCQPHLWMIVKGHIDTLIAWRNRATGADTGPRLYPVHPAE